MGHRQVYTKVHVNAIKKSKINNLGNVVQIRFYSHDDTPALIRKEHVAINMSLAAFRIYKISDNFPMLSVSIR